MASKKKKPSDLTVEILREIRDEVRGLREEMTQVKTEIHEVKDYMGQLNKLRVESETRLATALMELRQVTIETNTLIKGVRQDERIQELLERVERLEKKSA